MPKRKIVLVGVGGHGKVVADLIGLRPEFELVGGVDREPKAPSKIGLKSLGVDEDLPALLAKGVRAAAIGLGAPTDNSRRRRIRLLLEKIGFELPALVHPSAVVAEGVRLEPGAQIMARAVLNPGAVIGANSVVNTGAIVEHDCVLGRDCFVGPGAVLSGEVTLEDGAFVAAGATVVMGMKVGRDARVGAGAVALEDVPPGETVVGVPARPTGVRR